jgi:hypothetical protein
MTLFYFMSILDLLLIIVGVPKYAVLMYGMF